MPPRAGDRCIVMVEYMVEMKELVYSFRWTRTALQIERKQDKRIRVEALKFTFPDGTPGQFTFVADANGFNVKSDLLSVGKPLPDHAIAQIEAVRVKRDAEAASSSVTQVRSRVMDVPEGGGDIFPVLA
nr:uncharacterized protein LOC123746211 [Procambarus clarkii]